MSLRLFRSSLGSSLPLTTSTIHSHLVMNFHKTLSTLCSARCVNQARVDPSWQASLSLKKTEFVILNTRKPFSPLQQVLQMSLRLFRSSLGSSLPLTTFLKHFFFNFSKLRPFLYANSSHLCTLALALISHCLLHLLAESSFLKTLAELQLLILLEACWALGRDYQGLEVFFTRS